MKVGGAISVMACLAALALLVKPQALVRRLTSQFSAPCAAL